MFVAAASAFDLARLDQLLVHFLEVVGDFLFSRAFELMVAEGMSPMAAIRSATVTSAALLEVSDDLGTLEVGKLADLISVADDPLEDITALQRVRTVIKDGQLMYD